MRDYFRKKNNYLYKCQNSGMVDLGNYQCLEYSIDGLIVKSQKNFFAR